MTSTGEEKMTKHTVGIDICGGLSSHPPKQIRPAGQHQPSSAAGIRSFSFSCNRSNVMFNVDSDT